jgi:hypothetical protein
MLKVSVAKICNNIRDRVSKEDMKYRKAVPPEIRVYCCLYKLAHGMNLLHCSELFAVGRSTVGRVIHEVVCTINIVYRDVIRWPRNEDMHCVMLEFKQWCGMPFVHGAIDCTHIAISKPSLFPKFISII